MMLGIPVHVVTAQSEAYLEIARLRNQGRRPALVTEHEEKLELFLPPPSWGGYQITQMIPRQIITGEPMDEGDWLNTDDPRSLMHFLGNGLPVLPQKVDQNRKFGLVWSACMRHSGHEDQVVLAERIEQEGFKEPWYQSSVNQWSRYSNARNEPSKALIAHWIRDVFGNPFDPVDMMEEVSVGEAIIEGMGIGPICAKRRCSWVSSSIVQSLARAIFDERAWDRMPILADACEEAGCTDPKVLEHLRGKEQRMESSPEVAQAVDVKVWRSIREHWFTGGLKGSSAQRHPFHIRGCHVLDLILGIQ